METERGWAYLPPASLCSGEDLAENFHKGGTIGFPKSVILPSCASGQHHRAISAEQIPEHIASHNAPTFRTPFPAVGTFAICVEDRLRLIAQALMARLHLRATDSAIAVDFDLDAAQ
jgi:hypothetical protein